jgi:hypothetical protein
MLLHGAHTVLFGAGFYPEVQKELSPAHFPDHEVIRVKKRISE